MFLCVTSMCGLLRNKRLTHAAHCRHHPIGHAPGQEAIVQQIPHPDYLDIDVMLPARSSGVCMDYQHFRYGVYRYCDTLLICPIHRGLIPQGEHLTRRRSRWVARREVWVG